MTHLLPHPDPMPLREVLRTLRHGMRRSARALREAAPPDALPGPTALLARPVLDTLDQLARGVDEAGTDLAKRLLGGEAHHVPSLAAMLADPRHEEGFARAAYAALRAALRRMGDGDAFVSEVAARRAFAAVVRRDGPGDAAARAAGLGLALAEAGAVRDVATGPDLRVPAEQAAAVAVVAALLWLLADRGTGAAEPADDDGALDAATDIAVALAGEVAAILAGRDHDRLAGLLREFAAHV